MSEFISFNFVETDSKNCTGYMMLAKDGFWIYKEDAIKAMKASSNSLQQLKAAIAALANEMVSHGASVGTIRRYAERLRQLSAEERR